MTDSPSERKFDGWLCLSVVVYVVFWGVVATVLIREIFRD